MPMPSRYAHASQDYEDYINAVLDFSNLATRNQVYTMTEGVFRTFRRRLDVQSAIRFANGLPSVLAAIFIADWDMGMSPIFFASREAMTREVQFLRADHNFSPATYIQDVALALRRSLGGRVLDELLAGLPDGAAAFWVA
jgi:uncharacterized protein (DUF2267 family)